MCLYTGALWVPGYIAEYSSGGPSIVPTICGRQQYRHYKLRQPALLRTLPRWLLLSMPSDSTGILYSGRPGLLNRRYTGTTTARPKQLGLAPEYDQNNRVWYPSMAKTTGFGTRVPQSMYVKSIMCSTKPAKHTLGTLHCRHLCWMRERQGTASTGAQHSSTRTCTLQRRPLCSRTGKRRKDVQLRTYTRL